MLKKKIEKKNICLEIVEIILVKIFKRNKYKIKQYETICKI